MLFDIHEWCLVDNIYSLRGTKVPQGLIRSKDLTPNLTLFRPTNSKDYIHRVGRTARAGRAGKSITMVCQYDVEIYQKIEAAIGKKLEEWPHEKDQIMVLKERVDEAKRIAEQEIKVSF